MATVSWAESPIRISLGKKAKRTVTAPSIGLNQHGNDTKSLLKQHQHLENRYASQDNGLSPFAAEGHLSSGISSGSSTYLRDVKEVYTIQQVMRDTLETRRKPHRENSKIILEKQHHKKEFLRSWSRERIIVTEEVIYPTTNLSIASASGSFACISRHPAPHLQQKTYFPLVRCDDSASKQSLPAPTVTLVGAMPSHVAEYGRLVPLTTAGDGKNPASRGTRHILRKQASEPEGSTFLFSDISTTNSLKDARVVEVRRKPVTLRSPSHLSPHMLTRRSNSGVTKHYRGEQFSAAIYSLIEHADEDQLVQNISPLRPVEAAKSLKVVNEEEQRRSPLHHCVPVVEPPRLFTSNPLPHSAQSEHTSVKELLSPLVTSELLPISSPPEYQNKNCPFSTEETETTVQEDEDIRSTSTSVYETARSSVSLSPSREALLEPAHTPTNQSAPRPRKEEEAMTTVIDKLDVATETVIPTSPVYFRTIVRRDHAGYGLTVCGTNPVTVRNIREGGTAERAGLRPGDEIVKVNGVNVEDMDHQEVVERIRAKATVCFMLRRMRPSRSYLAVTADELTEQGQPSHRRYQKRRHLRETGSSGGTAAAVSRRRPNNHSRGCHREQSSSPSPPTFSGRTDTDGDENARAGGAGDSIAGTRGWVDEDVHSPTSQVKEEDPSLSTKFESVSSSGRLRGQSEGLEQSKRLSDCINAAPVACVPQIPPPGHYLGRSLNEDSDDDEIREEISAIAARFRSAANVLSSPSLCGVLLNYLLIQNRDLSPTLFYLVAKHYYWVQTHVKDLAKDFMRLLVEIYTTFLHEKSPLPVKVDSWIIQQMENSVLTKETATVFEGCCAAVLPQIQAQVDKLNKDILLGIDTWKPSENFDLTSVISREEELGIFESIISPRVNELQRIIAGLAPLQSPQQNPNQFSVSFNAPTASTVVTWLSSTSNATDLPKDQIAAALCYSLVSAYRYFAAGCSPSQPETPADDIGLGSVPICPSTPAPPQHSFKRTLFAKSIENLSAASTQSAGGSGLGSSTLSGSMSNSLATLGVINWEKLPTFNAKLKSKSSSVIFGSWKTRHSQKGHSLQDRIFDRTAECVVCGGLLWGLAPQGLACQGCDINVHYKCKSGLKEPCTKDTKSSSISRGSITNLAMSSSVGSPSGPLPASRSGTLSSPISPSQYPSPPEPACGSGPRVYCSWNVRKRKAQHRPSLSAMLTMESIVAASQHKAKHQSAGNFTSPLENNGNNFGESGDDGFSGLVASTEDIFHCQTCGLNEFLGDGSSDCPLQSTPFSPETTTSSSAIADDVKVKRSNSGFSHAQSTSLIRGSSHAGITSPEPISPLSDLSKAHIALIRSSSQVLRKTGSSRRSFFSSTLNLSGYVRNVKQKLDNHSSSAAAAALSKHTASLMQLPLMADRDLKRPSAPHAISSSASVSAAANVPELVPTWSGDPEMNALETFEAATELRIHFPNYEIPTKGPRVEDHVRTLVLLEFHQKVRYMVCYLKQFDYLLLQCWPKEHQRLADIMALDRIPRLIRLFRSLVHTIEGTLEPQGYGKMAEAVLAWLSEDDEANLKAWLRDCQALSCTNMLDSVKATVREYGRKHPDIQPLLETRFNKFVLIEGLSQVRVLYFNLPLISNNIMKDLEKKTSSYKNEAKLWKEIHTKLASIPHSIDKICMPLVKLINDGHFFSTVDKGEQLTRHQAQGGNVPFADILLEFPRTIFRYWVIDYAEIAVDKLTFTSDNRVNYDYVKERTDVLAILLNCALVLLVKDGGRYGLRPFKPSKEASVENANAGVSATSLGTTQSTPNMLGNTMKLSPVFSTDSVFTSRGEKIGHEYMLNMIFKEQAVLLRLSFSSKETREKWLNIIKEREEFSNQRRLAMQKTRSSLPPVSMHSSGDSKGETKSLKAIRGFTESPEPKIDINCVSQTVEPDMSANNSSPEALERQITHFTGMIMSRWTTLSRESMWRTVYLFSTERHGILSNG
uniref:Phorbol-ester/DAG-type domain-containing protein n=1 Tax=Mesocestoides corti TaxID=53468 RepID=A0A5K3EYF3_MESCO